MPETIAESRLERRKEETKKKIVAAALDLFRSQGFDATTMEQIAREADVAKGTLYNYFPVKEAILSEFIRRSFQEKNARRIQELRTLPDTRTRLHAMLEELISGIQSQPEIFERYFAYQLQQILSLEKTDRERSGFERLGVEIIRLGQAGGEIRQDMPASVLEDFFDFVFIEVAKQFFHASESFDRGAVIDACVDLFMNGASK